MIGRPSKSKLFSVQQPVINLKREPMEEMIACDRDDLQESQLLNNELFLALREEHDWYYGQAIEQPHYTAEKAWGGYPGWVKKSAVVRAAVIEPPNAVVMVREAIVFDAPDCDGEHLTTLPLGSRISADRANGRVYRRVRFYSGKEGWVHESALRLLKGSERVLTELLVREVLANASLFIGVPYLWGGRSIPLSAPIPDVAFGVDCSALVCLSHRLSGVDIPRNAHDQWLFTQPLGGDDMGPGDLVFIAKEAEPKIIRHVMICTGKESMIEASETGRTVCETSFTEKFGLSYEELRQSGFAAGGRQIYFGRITQGLRAWATM